MKDDTPLIYRNVWLYGAVMRLLHGREYEGRYTALAAEVPPGCSVTELCAGDARLFRRHLQAKGVRFTGLDNSPHFVEAGRKRGLDFREADLRVDPVPEADVVIIQASIHIFINQIDAVMDKLLAAARLKLLVAEPVRNMSSSPNPLLAFVGRTLTKPRGAGDYSGFRFDEASFRAFAEGRAELEKLTLCPGGREMIAVFRGRAVTPPVAP
jgi:hypothetical protein